MNNITWDNIMGDIRMLLAEYYELHPPEETVTIDDADVISGNIEKYVENLETEEVLEKVIEFKLYLED